MQTYPNPAGTNGFAFLEFTTPDPRLLKQQFESLGLEQIGKHQTAEVTIFQQDEIFFLLNNDPNGFAASFAKKHGPSVCGMGFKVNDAHASYQYALSKGAKPYDSQTMGKLNYDVPAICGVGNSVIYFIDDNNQHHSHFNLKLNPASPRCDLNYLDHVTHNLYRGNLDKLANFYETIFNFREVRYFDIEGRMTGLKSRAMTSACGKIRIPLNESSDDKSQIEEFLALFNGEGIQHIALGTNSIYTAVDKLSDQKIAFLSTPDTYYDLIEKRLPNHGEPVSILKEKKILIDGISSPEEKKLLLQIFTQNMLGPVFFEIIQRKGDEGFGEGNFKALFESLELDQINRGVLSNEPCTL